MTKAWLNMMIKHRLNLTVYHNDYNLAKHNG